MYIHSNIVYTQRRGLPYDSFKVNLSGGMIQGAMEPPYEPRFIL